MTLQQLTYLIAICEAGTISGAAKELSVSQPTVTQSLRDLERDLQVKLLDRSAGPGELKFTPKGEEVVARARAVLKAADELRRCVKSKAPAKAPAATKRKLGGVRVQLGDMEITAGELIEAMQEQIKNVKKRMSALEAAAEGKRPQTATQTKKGKK